MLVAILEGLFSIVKFFLPKAGESLIQKLTQQLKNREITSLEKKMDRARSAIENNNLIEYLKWKYKDENILQRGGCIYPVAIFPAPLLQRESVNSVLKLPLIKRPTDENPLYVDSSEYLDIVIKLGYLRNPETINMISYSMAKLSLDAKVEMECKLGTYFSSYKTCEVLEWEIRSKVEKLTGANESDFRDFDKKLPLRGYLHENVDNPVRDGKGRSAAVGISTLIAYNDEGIIKLLTKRRAKKGVPIRAGLLHVIPGFMFQSVAHDPDLEYNVIHNIYREYLEELFNLPENLQKTLPPKHFYSDKRLQYLKFLMDNDGAKLYFTGVSVNLLNLRPEICTLLYIKNPEWYEKCQSDPDLHWEINDEFTTMHEGIVKADEFIGGLKLSNDEEMIQEASLYPHRTVPAGAGTFWLGVDALREVLKNEKHGAIS